MANIHDRFRERVDALNAGLKACVVSVEPYLADYSGHARKPFKLWSRRGDYLARYGSFEAAEKAARKYEAL